ncbi:PREDICTED: uncharacterized protein LOC106114161 [Papilio xuthus]|uniref:Uncharacterized protein LOC106114161 n=1 Tax=Papilio xuthus TaxID=66420 RepID=A0AAJ6Z0L7_PAPXU|nr:PREDICTED: uncharacterized protein LOC106114161 [Papilio xuthus]
MSSDVESLKLQLKSVLRRKHTIDKIQSQLRTTERNLTNEISVVTNEISLLTEQLEILVNGISEVNTQIAVVEICKASEQCKMKEQVESLNQHVDGFKQLFLKEQAVQVQDIKAKEAEAEELKKKELQLEEEQKTIVSALEKETVMIERECAVLKKRNNAIMLKLRRQLLEANKIRQTLIKNKQTDF